MLLIILALGLVCFGVGLYRKEWRLSFVAAAVAFTYAYSLTPVKEWWAFALSALAVIALLAEFVLPTLGVLGILAAWIFYQALQWSEPTWPGRIVELGLGALTGLAIFLWWLRLGQVGAWTQSLVLKETLDQDHGFQAQQRDLRTYLGQEGQVVSPLRPAGKVRFWDGEILQVQSEADFLASGEVVVGLRIDNGHLIVRKQEIL